MSKNDIIIEENDHSSKMTNYMAEVIDESFKSRIRNSARFTNEENDDSKKKRTTIGEE